jgi:hypothetical protein
MGRRNPRDSVLLELFRSYVKFRKWGDVKMKMSKLFLVVLMAFFFALMCAPVMAGDVSETLVTSSTGTVIKATSGELVAIWAFDVIANTAVARSFDVFNNVSIQVSDSPEVGYLFSIVAPVGTYFPKNIFEGIVYNKWGYEVADGYTFSSGLCISPTADGTGNWAPKLIVQYQ